jgi:hypothetical protein
MLNNAIANRKKHIWKAHSQLRVISRLHHTIELRPKSLHRIAVFIIANTSPYLQSLHRCWGD